MRGMRYCASYADAVSAFVPKIVCSGSDERVGYFVGFDSRSGAGKLPRANLLSLRAICRETRPFIIPLGGSMHHRGAVPLAAPGHLRG
jgi:hypothetical protein